MTYAFLTDGLDDEARESFDKALAGKGAQTAARDRDALAAALRFAR